MSKSKDKRIRRLKKTRIWPSILGLLFISVCLGGIMLLVISFLLTDIVKNKMITGYENTESLIYLLEQVKSQEEIKEIENNEEIIDVE